MPSEDVFIDATDGTSIEKSSLDCCKSFKALTGDSKVFCQGRGDTDVVEEVSNSFADESLMGEDEDHLVFSGVRNNLSLDSSSSSSKLIFTGSTAKVLISDRR